MAWYAIDAIDDALNATRAFLFPFSLGRWGRLALITLFVGGGGFGIGNVTNIARIGEFANNPPGSGPPSVLRPLWGADSASLVWPVAQAAPPAPDLVSGAVGAALLGLLLLLGLGVALIGSVLQFVFVDAIATDEVRLVAPFRQYLGFGLRYLGFQIGIALIALVPLLIVGIGFAETNVDLGTVAVLGVGLLLVVIGIPYLFVARFTREFVVPVMVASRTGLIEGWRRLGPRLRQQWKQFGIYFVFHFFVKLGAGIARSLVAIIGGILVAIVALIIGFLLGAAVEAALGGGAGGAGLGLGLLFALAIGGLLFLLLVLLPLNVLVQTFVRCYELSSLGGFDESFGLLGYGENGTRAPENGSNGEAQDATGASGEMEGREVPESADTNAGEDDEFGGFVPASDQTDDKEQ